MPIRRETLHSYLYLLKWISIAVISGILSSTVVEGFLSIHILITSGFVTLKLPLFIWPAAGAILTTGVIYRLSWAASGEGIPAYIAGLNRRRARFSLKVTVTKFLASISTLSTFGNGGVVGPLGRINSGLMTNLLGGLKKIGFTDFDRRTAGICGMAATLGALFHSSVGGGVFAVEIIQKTEMRYRDLFPAVLASAVAAQFSRLMGWSPFFMAPFPAEVIKPEIVVFILVVAVITGFLGKFYIQSYQWIAKLCRKGSAGSLILKAVAASLIAGFAAWIVHPSLLGTSKGIIDFLLLPGETLEQPLPLKALGLGMALLFILIKGAANIITVGSGMSAGFTGPSLIIGMLVGYSMALIIGVDLYSNGYYALLAAGFASMMGSSINVPIAAAVIGVELFGLYYGLPCGLGAVIGFQINRHFTLYDYAKNGKPTGR